MTPWIQTRSGRAVDLLNPDPADIDLGDLAYALAHLNRYTGHAGAYSVAEHSVRVLWALEDEGHPRDVLRAGLMHDAHEAIVGDVSSPVKRAIRALFRDTLDPYAEDVRRYWGLSSLDSVWEDGKAPADPWTELEARAARAVAVRFGLPLVLPDPVRTMDLRMLLAEARDLMAPPPKPWGIDVEPHPGRIRPWTAQQAQPLFLSACRRLGVK